MIGADVRLSSAGANNGNGGALDRIMSNVWPRLTACVHIPCIPHLRACSTRDTHARTHTTHTHIHTHTRKQARAHTSTHARTRTHALHTRARSHPLDIGARATRAHRRTYPFRIPHTFALVDSHPPTHLPACLPARLPTHLRLVLCKYLHWHGCTATRTHYS